MIESMKNTVDIPLQDDPADVAEAAFQAAPAVRADDDTIEQLTLLPKTDVALRFRLPAETRSRGLRHIAEIRQLLAARQAARDVAVVHRLPPRTKRAA
jgi:hypothetical protein